MKKSLWLLFLTAVLTVLFGVTAYAATTAEIDITNASKGIVTVTLTDYKNQTVKAQVVKGSDTYNYSLIKETTNLPLTMGTGEYTVRVMIPAGSQYKVIASQTVKPASIDESAMYKASIPMVEYSVSTKAVPAFDKLTESLTGEKDKITTIFGEIVSNYSYDTDKAKTVAAGYVPVIDDTYTVKKGICYDYASLLAGMLRKQGIPTRLVMGYVPEIESYHAWNEIYIGGKWTAVDATYDAACVKAGVAYTMEKDRSKTTVLKIY